jgi:hypothetical protein
VTSSGSNKETNSEQIRRLADRFYEEVKAACVDDCANPIVSPTAFGFKKAGSDGERAEQLLALTIYSLIFELCRRKFNPKILQVLFPEEPFTPREFFDAQKDVVAEEYGRAGKPDKAAFARYMADYNKGRTREHRLGSGSEDPDNMKTYLKKLLREKKYRDTVDRTCELVKNGTCSRLVIPDHFFKKPGRRKSGSIFKKVVPR